MATTKRIIIEGKLVPTLIAFDGSHLDEGEGNMRCVSEIRDSGGALTPDSDKVYDLKSQLSFVDSQGISGAQVMQFLGEWFDHVNA